MSNERRKPFPFDQFEPKWQRHWDDQQTFHAPNPGEPGFDPAKPKFYVLDMFPYPSGAGLHVGHPEGYTATDIIARFKRMRGFNVLHPMGWDAFGLPAEQYAIKTGQHPRTTTEKNINGFRGQLQRIGFAYDWQREVNTTDPGYFKWTQWIFLQLYNSWLNPATNKAEPIESYTGADPDSFRLAYVSEAPVNWCPELGTVLANEEVIDGKSEVGGHPVEHRPMRQWMLRITAFAQRLIDELDGLDWPESIKLLQRNWIGRSEGAEVDFKVAESDETIRVFTTRPDTLFGATYMVLAPEHRLVDEIVTEEQWPAVRDYREKTARKNDLERTELAKEKTGVFTGAFAINPVNDERIPIWIADYVLTGYGTGAIMAVPAHDFRDCEFAGNFGLPTVQVIDANCTNGRATSEAVRIPVKGKIETVDVLLPMEGEMINSGFLNGLDSREARGKITAWLEERGLGKKTVNYKLRDWLFSRQRYWGEPFPIVWENGRHRALDASELPLTPPEMDDFKPTGTPEPPLSKAADWLRYSEKATRETNTMPQWAGSCWYYLRYCDAKNSERFVGADAEKYWMGGGKPGGVDLYIGGTEHAVLHLLYARFWHKVLFDLGHVSTPEPFQKLVNQGLILGEIEHYRFQVSDEESIEEAYAFRPNENWFQGPWISADEIVDIKEAGQLLIGKHKQTGKVMIAAKINDPERVIEKRGGDFFLKGTNIKAEVRTTKMSKSRGNVVNPDDVIREYGADALRCYEMFMGPLEQVKPWSMTGVEGVFRFLARVWRLVMEENQTGEWILSSAVQDVPMDKALAKVVHATIKKVGEDIEELSFNTAISQMMICTNALTAANPRPVAALRLLLQVLNPFAPHLTEELWERLGSAGTVTDQPWPAFDPALLIEDEIEMPIQVNGKVRDKVVVKKDAAREEIEALARSSARVAEWTAGKEIKKVVVVPGKLVNIVVV